MKRTLLIAEGDAELCDAYRRFLSRNGYEVETASDGLDCLAKLRRVRPAAVVLDLELRWGGGDGVVAWLRENPATSEVPVVLTASALSNRDILGAIRPPVVGLLTKPFALADLLERVETALPECRSEERFNGNPADACPEYLIG